MGKLRVMALAGAAAIVTVPAAQAADLPPVFYKPAPVVEDFAGGWYLRGDVGVGAQKFRAFDFTQTNVGTGGAWPASWRIDQHDMKDTFFVGGGIGYQFNNWLRVDVTGEYRADVKFKAVGSYTEFCPAARCFDLYDGDHSAVVVLANAYFDLGTWWRLTPFVGVGVGTAYHKTAALSDIGLPTAAFGFANTDHTQWNFAWAVHAGVAYDVNPSFKVELAYRYLNMGSVNTAEINCGGAGCDLVGGGPRAYYTLKNLDSHDFKLGVRWLLNPMPAPVYAPPVMTKG